MALNYFCVFALQTLLMPFIYPPPSLCKLHLAMSPSTPLTSKHRSAGMYMQEVLEVVCRKRKLANLKDYALIVNELNMLAYLDRTVASLGGRRELTLVKRSTLPQLGIEPESRSARTTDPNGTSNHLTLRMVAKCFSFSSFHFQTDIGSPRDAAKRCGRLRDSLQGSLSFLMGVLHGVNFR
jgi:hypothetical protein